MAKSFIFHLCKSNWHIANHQNTCLAWVGKWIQDWIMIYFKSHSFRKKNYRLTSDHSDFKCIILQYTLYTLDYVILFQWTQNIRKHSWFKVDSPLSQNDVNFSQAGNSFLFFLAKQFDCLLLLLSERESLLGSYRDGLLKKGNYYFYKIKNLHLECF